MRRRRAASSGPQCRRRLSVWACMGTAPVLPVCGQVVAAHRFARHGRACRRAPSLKRGRLGHSAADGALGVGRALASLAGRCARRQPRLLLCVAPSVLGPYVLGRAPRVHAGGVRTLLRERPPHARPHGPPDGPPQEQSARFAHLRARPPRADLLPLPRLCLLEADVVRKPDSNPRPFALLELEFFLVSIVATVC